MADAAGVFIKIGASSKELVSEVGKAGKSLKGLDGEGKKLNKGLKIISKSFIGMGVAAAGAGIAITALTTSVIDNAKEIRNLSAVAGVSTTEFQKMAFASSTVGVEQDKLSDILKDVNDKVGDFLENNAGGMKDFFTNIAPRVGVTADMFKKLSSRDALQLYVDTLEKANVSQATMTFHLESIASDATLLLPLLKNNGRAMHELGTEADALGLVLSNIELLELEAAGVEITKLKASFTALGNELALTVLPTLSKLLTVWTTFMGETRKEESIESAKKNISGLVIELNTAEKALKSAEDSLSGMNEKLASIKSAGELDIFTDIARKEQEIVALSAAVKDLSNQFRGAATEGGGGVFISADDANLKIVQAAIDAEIKAKKELAEFNDRIFQDQRNRWIAEDAAQSVRIGSLTDSLLTEQEVKQASYDQDLADLKEANDAELEQLGGFNEAKKRLDEAYAESKAVIDQVTYKDTLSAASGMFGDLSTLMDRENKAGFEIGKAAAIANAGIKSALAAINSFEAGSKLPGGPVTGAAFAAASLAATLPMISDLAGMSYGGGGGGSAPSVAAPQVAQQQSTTAQFSLTGDTFSRQTVEDMFDQLNEGFSNGLVLNGIESV
jgi:hypothetical protein